jgi:subtilisin-like proprotein convertase family protein
MKRLLLILSFIPTLLFAQTFTNNTFTEVPANGNWIDIPITVSGLPTVADTNFGALSVCLYITHTWMSDLQLLLISPNGTTITLADQKGGWGEGYFGTCFQEDATNGWITFGNAPFYGSYYPQQSINLFNDGQNPNGTWYLHVRDVFTPSDTGSVQYWNITFGPNPPPDPSTTSGPCSQTNPGGCACPDGSNNCDLLPDMTASAACIIGDHQEFANNITLANATPNIGWGPLEIHGINQCYCDTVQVPCSTTLCPDSTAPKQLVNQRVYHRTGNVMTYYDRPAGTMTYHPSHGHTHVDGWAHFSLRRSTPNPDASTWPIIGTGTKQSYCLVNLGDCTSDYGYCVDNDGNILTQNDIPNSGFGSVTGCGVDQGIYTGYLDIYSSGLNGMGIILPANACNGDYYIVSITDPDNNFLETDDSNNWCAVPITLTLQLPYSFPQAGFTYSIAGDTVDFSSSASVADSVDSCVWVWGDASPNDTLAGLAAQHIFPGPGTYVVFLYAYNQCGPTVSADTIVIVNTGINAATEQVVSFNIFPNPVRDEASMVYTLVNPGEITLQLFDAVGHSLKQYTAYHMPGKYLLMLDAKRDNLPSGVYIAKLTAGNVEMNKRVTIVR